MSPLIKHPKRRGEWVELQFMARAASYGLTVSKPWGDSARYDFVVEHQGQFSRVQVKSTASYSKRSYHATCSSHGHKPYLAGEIDFMAIYVVPEDIWYVVPHEAIQANRYALWLAPRRSNNKYFRYMEAWHLLKRAPAAPRSSA